VTTYRHVVGSGMNGGVEGTAEARGWMSDFEFGTAPVPLGKAEVTAQAVLDFMRSRPGERLSREEIREGVQVRLGFSPTDSALRRVLTQLVDQRDNHLLKAGRSFAWAPDGVLPPPPTPPHVVKMIELRANGQSLDEIGQQFGVTRERVRQLLTKHGGPSASESRAVRHARAQRAQADVANEVATALRSVLMANGPLTLEAASSTTGLDIEAISRFWPEDLAHMRLWSSGSTETRWSDEEILDALRAAALYEFPLTTKAYARLVSIGEIRGPSLPRVGQRFGSWTAACEAAGVVPGQTLRKNYDSKWSDADLLLIVRKYLLDPNCPNSARYFDEWKRSNVIDGPSFQTARNRFGTWTEVKRQALANEGLLSE
jgi:hypothetical protein